MDTTIGRRSFLQSSAAAGLTVLSSKSVFGAPSGNKVNLGIIGCGGRGSHVAASFMEHTDTRVTAIADLFDDKLREGKKRFNELLRKKGEAELSDSRLFQGSDAYRRLLDLKDVDAVLIATPHFVHPEHLSAAVDAGKHVYLEKPVAVDVNGCREVILAGKRAEGKVSLAVGFQIRCASPFVKMVDRIHDGDIGDIAMGQTFYLAGGPNRTALPGISADERRMRLWALDRALSGDNILLQGVHVVDICNWVLKSHPVKAVGAGGRKARDDIGDNWSYFLVQYEYPGEIPVSFQSQQFNPGYGDVCERFFGTKGISESHYSGGVFIKGEHEWDSGVARGTQEEISDKDWEAGAFRSALDDADQNKQKAFIDSIRSGAFLNEAYSGAESTLSAILGTIAAYRGEDVTWDEMMASGEKIEPLIDLTQFDRR